MQFNGIIVDILVSSSQSSDHVWMFFLSLSLSLSDYMGNRIDNNYYFVKS